MTVVTTTPPKRQSKYERSRRCPRKLRKVSGGLGLRLIQCLCLCPALSCKRLKSLRCHRVEYASRQPFGTGSLLLQIVKLGHDPALIFQDNLRRMSSFRRCSGLSECEVKSVRRVTHCLGFAASEPQLAEEARSNTERQPFQSARQHSSEVAPITRKATCYLSLFLVGKPTEAQ